MEDDNLGLVKISTNDVSVTYDGIRVSGGLRIPRRIKHKALDSITLDIDLGETVALLGKNGAGKTTLLRFLAGKIRPSRGSSEVSGRVVHLSGVNPGFDIALSSRQNIIWLSSVYGVESESICSEVEEFANIGDAFERPVKTLSAGMRGRIGFGFATSLNPDILLIDEVLGVGDPSFKAKATDRLKKMISASGIVMISTHSVGLVKELASRAIVLENGILKHDGDVQVALEIYSSI